MASNSLDYITIKGFKSIASIENLKLRPINVLIGANGAGKSNFLGVFTLMRAVSDGAVNNYVGAEGAERLLHFGSKVTPAITVRFAFSSDTGSHEFTLKPTASGGMFIAEPVTDPADAWRRAFAPPAHPDDPIKSFPWVSEVSGRWRSYHFHDTSESAPMRTKNPNIDDNRFLRPDGSNLAAYLYYLRERHNPSYDLIRKTVQQVAPFFRDFILEPRGLNSEFIRLEWRHRNSDDYFDVSSLSDGTLRFIALATLFLQPKEHRPSLILVDEPELGLHPFAIGLLASMIQRAAVDTQVIVSTQSALLLDYFEPEDVLVADCVDGATQLTRLDPDRLARWLNEYSLGELWEKNEIGGRPGSR